MGVGDSLGGVGVGRGIGVIGEMGGSSTKGGSRASIGSTGSKRTGIAKLRPVRRFAHNQLRITTMAIRPTAAATTHQLTARGACADMLAKF